VIKPNIEDVDWTEFYKYKKCIKAGEMAASRKVSAIKKLLYAKRCMPQR
jgi:hypothetical protein